MESAVKHIAKLILSDDGRGALNWGPYRLQVENSLVAYEKGNIRLLHVLQNRCTGIQVEDPGLMLLLGSPEHQLASSAPKRTLLLLRLLLMLGTQQIA